jgi:hypothetical protein
MGSKAFGYRKLKEGELVAEHPCSSIGSSCIFQTKEIQIEDSAGRLCHLAKKFWNNSQKSSIFIFSS